ncbi:S1/P1 nuclease [Schleiferiaceae bacterium]|nr:S1/P1 nuclease [Schleiferiaceae bacterium]
MRKLITFCAFILTLNSFGWGLTGHRIVGHIAMEHLNPEVKQHILNTLKGEDLAMVSNWMDFIKSESAYDSLKPYHYCTIVDVEAIKTHEHPKQGDVWMAIDRFLQEIENEKYSVTEGFALRALAHLIGDAHQPLHCGNGTDMGGNQVKVNFFKESSNLHRVWDSGMIDFWKMSYTEYSEWIMSTVQEEQLKQWENSNTEDWIRESVISREQCYETMGNPDKMGYRYIYENKDLLHKRLAQAGVRLADALNKAYASR